jgi:hypothetical protein
MIVVEHIVEGVKFIIAYCGMALGMSPTVFIESCIFYWCLLSIKSNLFVNAIS